MTTTKLQNISIEQSGIQMDILKQCEEFRFTHGHAVAQSLIRSTYEYIEKEIETLAESFAIPKEIVLRIINELDTRIEGACNLIDLVEETGRLKNN